MSKISWGDNVSNEQVLKRVGEPRTILNTTKEKRQWTGHVFRHDGLLVAEQEGRMAGIGHKGNKWIEIPDDIIAKETYVQMK
jgi:hypothetical protein